MYNTEHCTKGQAPPVSHVIRRSLADKLLLRWRLDSMLQERDELLQIIHNSPLDSFPGVHGRQQENMAVDFVLRHVKMLPLAM